MPHCEQQHSLEVPIQLSSHGQTGNLMFLTQTFSTCQANPISTTHTITPPLQTTTTTNLFIIRFALIMAKLQFTYNEGHEQLRLLVQPKTYINNLQPEMIKVFNKTRQALIQVKSNSICSRSLVSMCSRQQLRMQEVVEFEPNVG